MALSKRKLIKRSKSQWHPRSISIQVSLVDLSGVLQLPINGARQPKGELDSGYEDLPTITPREAGISKLFSGLS